VNPYEPYGEKKTHGGENIYVKNDLGGKQWEREAKKSFFRLLLALSWWPHSGKMQTPGKENALGTMG